MSKLPNRVKMKACRDCSVVVPMDGRQFRCPTCALKRKQVVKREWQINMYAGMPYETATCPVCGDEFRKHGPQRWCSKKCKAEHIRTQDRLNGKGAARAGYNTNRALKEMYGITIHDKERMISEQGGRCPICTTAIVMGRRSHIDHCHSSGKIRGVLCGSCNSGLGLFKDNQASLAAAIDYLKKHQNG
jgi:RNA polymerase subunit RPABC4/transcription elongation factor Spt4